MSLLGKAEERLRRKEPTWGTLGCQSTGLENTGTSARSSALCSRAATSKPVVSGLPGTARELSRGHT